MTCRQLGRCAIDVHAQKCLYACHCQVTVEGQGKTLQYGSATDTVVQNLMCTTRNLQTHLLQDETVLLTAEPFTYLSLEVLSGCFRSVEVSSSGGICTLQWWLMLAFVSHLQTHHRLGN